MSWGTDEPPVSSSYTEELARRYGPPEPPPTPEPAESSWPSSPGPGYGDVDPGSGYQPPPPSFYTPPNYTPPAYQPPAYQASGFGGPGGAYDQNYQPPPLPDYQPPAYGPPPAFTPSRYDEPPAYDPSPPPSYQEPQWADNGGFSGPGGPGGAMDTRYPEDYKPPVPGWDWTPPEQQLASDQQESWSSPPQPPQGAPSVADQPSPWFGDWGSQQQQAYGDQPAPGWRGVLDQATQAAGDLAGGVVGGMNHFFDGLTTSANFGREGAPSLSRSWDEGPIQGAAATLGAASPQGVFEGTGPGLALRGLPAYATAVTQGTGDAWNQQQSQPGAPGGIVGAADALGAGFEAAKRQGEGLEQQQPQDFPYQHGLQAAGAQIIPDVALELASGGYATPALAAKYGRYAPRANAVADTMRALVNPASVLPREAQAALGGLYAGQIVGGGLDLPEDQRNLVSAATAAVPSLAPLAKQLPGVSYLARPARSTRQLMEERAYADHMGEAMHSGLLSDPEAVRNVVDNVPLADQPNALQELLSYRYGGAATAEDQAVGALSNEAAAALPSYLPGWLRQFDQSGDELSAMQAAAKKQSGLIRETDENLHPLNPLEQAGRWASETPVLKQIGQAAGDATSAFKQAVLMSGRFFGQNTGDAALKNGVQGVGIDMPGSEGRLQNFIADYGLAPPASITDSVNEQVGHSGSDLLNSIPYVGDVLKKYVNPVLAKPMAWNSNLEQGFRLPLFEANFEKVTNAALDDLKVVAGQTASEMRVPGSGAPAFTPTQIAALQEALGASGGRMSANDLRTILSAHGIHAAEAEPLVTGWADLLKQAGKAGEQAVSDTHFDYGNRSVADTALGTVLPFSTWGTRNPPALAGYMGQHPAAGNVALDYQQESQRQQDEGGLPNSYANRIDTGIDLNGKRLYSDLGAIHPLAGQIKTYYPPENAPTLSQMAGMEIPVIGAGKPGEWMARLAQLGATPYPWQTAGPQAVGWLGGRPPQGGTLPWQRLLYSVLADQKVTPDGVVEQKIDDALRGGSPPSPLTADRTLNSRWAQRIAELAMQQNGGKPIDQSPELLAQSQDPNSPLARQAYDEVRRDMAIEGVNTFFNPLGGKLLSPEAEAIYAARKAAKDAGVQPDFNSPAGGYRGAQDSEQLHLLRLQNAELNALPKAQQPAYLAAHPELGTYYQRPEQSSMATYLEARGVPATTRDRADATGALVGQGSALTFAQQQQPATPEVAAGGGGVVDGDPTPPAIPAGGVVPTSPTAPKAGPPLPLKPFSPNQQAAVDGMLQQYTGEQEKRRLAGREPLPALEEILHNEGIAPTDYTGVMNRGYGLINRNRQLDAGLKMGPPAPGTKGMPALTLGPDGEPSAPSPPGESAEPWDPRAVPAGASANEAKAWRDMLGRVDSANQERRLKGLPPLPSLEEQWANDGVTQLGSKLTSVYSNLLPQHYADMAAVRAANPRASSSAGGGRSSGGGAYNRSVYPSGGGGGVNYQDQRIDRAKATFQSDLDGVNQQLRVAGLPAVPSLDEFAANEGLSGDELLNRGYQSMHEAKNQLAAQPAVRQFNERLAGINARLKAAGQPEIDGQSLLQEQAQANGLTDQRAILQAAHEALSQKLTEYAGAGVQGFAPAARGGGGAGATTQAGWDQLRQQREQESQDRLAQAQTDYQAQLLKRAEDEKTRATTQAQRDLERETLQKLYAKQGDDQNKANLERVKQQAFDQQTRGTEREKQQAEVDAIYQQMATQNHAQQLATAHAALVRALGRGGGPATDVLNRALYAPQAFATAINYGGGSPSVDHAPGRGFIPQRGGGGGGGSVGNSAAPYLVHQLLRSTGGGGSNGLSRGLRGLRSR